MRPLLLTFLTLSLLTTVSFAQYNPLVESPIDVVGEAIPDSPKTEKAEPQTTIKTSDDIQFDPDRGIILPESSAATPPTTRQRKFETKQRHENYLISEVDKQKDSSPQKDVEEDEKGYIDRQIERQFGEMISYLKEVGASYKKAFSFLLDKFLIILSIIKEWPLVKNPPPFFLSFPLLCVLYFLICYPLVKIGRTVTNQEWMGWVPILQLVLLLKITERSLWMLLVFIIPAANLFLLAIIFIEICDMFRQPAWYGIFILVPGINIALLWYLAYVEFE